MTFDALVVSSLALDFVLNFSALLGHLHLLDGLIDEVFMSDPGKTYIWKGTRISKISSEDVNKSAAIATIERDSEKSRDFRIHLGLMIDSEDKLFNKLPSEIKEIKNSKKFKALTKAWIWKNIPAY